MFYIRKIINYFIVVFLFQFAANAVWGQSVSAEKVAQLTDKSPSIVLHNLSLPSAIEIENTSTSTVLLDWKIEVEGRKGGKWSLVHLLPQLELIEVCSLPKTTPCFELASKATFKPLPWTGFTCSQQCINACRANVYRGPGTFRYVLHSCDKSQRFYSPSFSLPADGSKYWLETMSGRFLDGMHPAENHQ